MEIEPAVEIELFPCYTAGSISTADSINTAGSINTVGSIFTSCSILLCSRRKNKIKIEGPLLFFNPRIIIYLCPFDVALERKNFPRHAFKLNTGPLTKTTGTFNPFIHLLVCCTVVSVLLKKNKHRYI